LQIICLLLVNLFILFSTISLACEALNDKDIRQTKEIYNNYINVITEENIKSYYEIDAKILCVNHDDTEIKAIIALN